MHDWALLEPVGGKTTYLSGFVPWREPRLMISCSPGGENVSGRPENYARHVAGSVAASETIRDAIPVVFASGRSSDVSPARIDVNGPVSRTEIKSGHQRRGLRIQVIRGIQQ